jgi:LysR family transcriptional regulator, low CO2-responsive transcriptional regulator
VDIDQLTAFDHIVREGSFSRAAWVLGIAQPTISARVQALEQAVGGPLLERTSRRVSLTTLGESFLPYARRALSILSEGVEAARQAEDGQRGRLSLGVLGSLAGCVLGPALAEFHRAHRYAEYYVRAGSHQKVVELLCDGAVELALVAWPCVEPPLVELAPVLRLCEPVVLVTPRGHPLAGQSSVTEEQVASHCAPLLLVRWWQTTHPSVARIAARASSVANVPPETARELIANGVGIGFFTRVQVADLLDSGLAAEVPLAGAQPLWRESALVRVARSSPLSPMARAFVATMTEYAEFCNIKLDK